MGNGVGDSLGFGGDAWDKGQGFGCTGAFRSVREAVGEFKEEFNGFVEVVHVGNKWGVGVLKDEARELLKFFGKEVAGKADSVSGFGSDTGTKATVKFGVPFNDLLVPFVPGGNGFELGKGKRGAAFDVEGEGEEGVEGASGAELEVRLEEASGDDGFVGGVGGEGAGAQRGFG